MRRKLLRLPEISEMTGIPETTLRYLRSKGKGPKTFIVASRICAFESDVDAWIDECAAKEYRGTT